MFRLFPKFRFLADVLTFSGSITRPAPFDPFLELFYLNQALNLLKSLNVISEHGRLSTSVGR